MHTWKLLGYLPLRSVRLHRLRLRAGRAVSRVPGRAAAHPFAVRPVAARHPRKFVRMPAIGAPSRAAYPHDLYDRRRDRRHRRRAADADHRDRLARLAGLPALGRRAGHARARRRRPALWRSRRRRHLHGRARPVLRHRSAILVLLDRPAAGRGGDVPAERHPRRPGAAGFGMLRSRRDRAGARDARARQALRLAGRRRRHRRSSCRRACAMR